MLKLQMLICASSIHFRKSAKVSKTMAWISLDMFEAPFSEWQVISSKTMVCNIKHFYMSISYANIMFFAFLFYLVLIKIKELNKNVRLQSDLIYKVEQHKNNELPYIYT